ncbi:recombinase family protein [Paracoccus mutanolyticus]|uniref:recombinase family protein n=1 Tax=Paracoccus mutanolyticus TaxID=1499308 RepID=UPI0037C9442B
MAAAVAEGRCDAAGSAGRQAIAYLEAPVGKSGLGLEGQKRDIAIFLERFSEEPYEIIAEHQDVQTGKDDDRPQLAAALALVRATPGAELLVSKLDRLSRPRAGARHRTCGRSAQARGEPA